MLNSYQISPKIDDIVKGTFFSNLHSKDCVVHIKYLLHYVVYII